MPLCVSSGHALRDGAPAGFAADATRSTQMYNSYSAALHQKSETSFAEALDLVVPLIRHSFAASLSRGGPADRATALPTALGQ